MSNSSLVQYTKLSPHYRQRTGKISKITIHHAAAVNASLSSLGNAFSGSRVASSNYGIDVNGNIGMYVEESNRAITSSNTANDNVAVTIEVVNDSGDPNWHVSDKSLNALVKLCVDICKRNGIAKLNYTGDKNGNLTRHNMFAATACPGPYLQSKFPWIVEQVNKQLVVEEPKKETTTNARPVLSEGSTGEYVKKLQNRLNELGYNCGTADGSFGPKTRAQVVKFQKDRNLTTDGVVGEKTWAALDKGFEPYAVKVTASVLNIRAGAGTNYKVNGQIKDKGVYTIVAEKNGWGQLKSGAGWIYLDYTKRV